MLTSASHSPTHHVTMLLAVIVCAGIPAAQASRPLLPDFPDDDYLLVLTSEIDYTAGNFDLISMDPPWESDLNQGGLHSDTVARFYDGLVYVIERYGADNIRVIDPQDGFATTLQFSVGMGSNPQDICFVDEHRAFVTRHLSAELWEVDPATGEHTDSIDLSPLADSDGIPEMHSMAIHGERLYVTLQRLDAAWLPVPPSYLAVIDLATNALVDMDPEMPGMQGIPLTGTNPRCLITREPLTGCFLIGTAGADGVLDGGLERFDPRTEESLGFVVTEAALGGDLNAWGSADGITGYAIAMTPFPDSFTSLLAFDFASGAILGTLSDPQTYAHTHIFVDAPRQQVFVTDRTYENPGIRVFDAQTFAPVIPQPLGTGLYPHWILGLHGPGSHVADDTALPADIRMEVWPQPSAGPVTLRIELATSREVSLEILDLCGRQVSVLHAAFAGSGWNQLQWDGRDHRGRAVQSGVYLARVRAGDRTAVRKIHLTR